MCETEVATSDENIAKKKTQTTLRHRYRSLLLGHCASRVEQPAPLLFAAAADAAAANLGECAPTVIASVVWAFAKAAQPAAALYAAVAAEAERRLPEFDASQRASMAVSFAAAGHADLAAGFRPAEAEGGEAAAMEVAADGQLAEEEAAVAAAVAETALGESDA